MLAQDDLLSNFNYSGNSRVVLAFGSWAKCSHTANMFGYYSLERLQIDDLLSNFNRCYCIDPILTLYW